jgi:hypothetical protein
VDDLTNKKLKRVRLDALYTIDKDCFKDLTQIMKKNRFEEQKAIEYTFSLCGKAYDGSKYGGMEGSSNNVGGAVSGSGNTGNGVY